MIQGIKIFVLGFLLLLSFEAFGQEGELVGKNSWYPPQLSSFSVLLAEKENKDENWYRLPPLKQELYRVRLPQKKSKDFRDTKWMLFSARYADFTIKEELAFRPLGDRKNIIKYVYRF